ncbi:transcriptional regulator [Corallincola holothuriorum]|uniref:Transcriptional regulator n=1 Tax=Corallincola holothuriorum TaxID=2282215 RepID=A0A368NPS2_9GAMM|nr:MucB/RseB C-terminal domain-containing protein [Corallincola holothuriorum]RCU51855.1 transcriptional regulator [Corallincola holothuriorum]
MKLPLIRSLFTGLLLSCTVFSASGAEAPELLLSRMVDAFRQQTYVISMVQNFGGRIEPLRFEHGFVDGVEISHLSYLNGPMRDIVRKGETVSYLESERTAYSLKAGQMDGPIPRAFLRGFKSIAENYQFVLGGRSRTAGRIAQLIRITPNEADRFGLLVWADIETGFMLRADVISSEGDLVEQLQVVSLQLLDKPSAHLKAIATSEFPQTVATPAKSTERELVEWRVGWTPSGFELVGKDQHRLALINDVVDYMMFSDGLIKFSVYINKVDDTEERGSLVTRGALSLFSLINSGIEITVVGRLPPETAQRIAETIYPVVNKPKPKERP